MSPKLRKKLEEMEGGGFFQQLIKSALIGVSDYIVRPPNFNQSKVRYGWINRPMDMPPLHDLAQMVASTYDTIDDPQIQGYTLFTKTPTMAVFRVNKNSNVFIIALRGTQFSDVNDLTADMAIIRGIVADAATARNVRNSSRYRTDVANITEVEGLVKSYLKLPNPIYYAVGHSLSGSIIDEMLRDGLISSAVSFNPAVERVNLDAPNNNHRVYLECDVLYNLIGKFITNGNLEVIPKANPAGADAGPIDTTKGSLECHNIKTVIPLMSGKGINNNIVLSYKQPLMFQDVKVGAYRNANEKFRPLGRGLFDTIIGNIGKNLAGEASKGNILGRIKDTIDKGAAARKAEQDKEWNDSWVGKILPNPTKLFGGADGNILDILVPKNRRPMEDDAFFQGRGLTDVLRYGRGKKFNQKQLTKIILDKNKVIADLEENAYSGRGNCVDGMGNCVGEMVRRIGETLADYRRRVAEAPQRRREARREEERQAAEAAERQRIQAAYDADATRLLTELQNDPNDQFGRNEFRRMMQGMDRYNQNLSPIEIWRYFRQMMYDQHQLSYEEARPRVRPPRPIGPQLPPAVSASGLLDFEMDEDGN